MPLTPDEIKEKTRRIEYENLSKKDHDQLMIEILNEKVNELEKEVKRLKAKIDYNDAFLFDYDGRH